MDKDQIIFENIKLLTETVKSLQEALEILSNKVNKLEENSK